MDLKKYWERRKEKWGKRWNLSENPVKNRKINYIVLALETIVMLWVLWGVTTCPCALRTCGIKHYQADGQTLSWEAENLDCDFVQKYIDGETHPDFSSFNTEEDNQIEFKEFELMRDT